ncbi:hypothetical protein HBI07_059900 [Parastagonospora nodorum]|nr:hypothetical protein HBI07_059900 [Parastagonospora nodorum]
MWTLPTEPRTLASKYNCGQCRKDRQKCVRPTRTSTCERCIRFKHHCDPGRLSNRGQQSRKRRSPNLDPDVQMIAVPGDAVQLALGMYESPEVGDQEIVSPYSGTTSISLESAEVSSRNSSLDSTPEMEHLNLDSFPNLAMNYGGSETFLDAIELPVHRWLQDSLEYGVENDSEILAITEPILVASPICAQPCTTLASSPKNCPGLNNMRPSRLRTRTTFETRLENRIVRLWDSYEAFTLTDARSGVLAVTPLFAATFSELFRWSRQMAEGGDKLVSLTRFACGAADAWMNTKLHPSTRAEYLKAYNLYDCEARTSLWRAVHEFAQKVREGQMPDVMPLYIATFLHHAAGACIRGVMDVDAAMAAFKYYDGFTAGFPIRILRSPTSDGRWAVDMLLANNDRDPGMRISSLMFALGKARLRFDRQEGLC